MKIIEFKNNYHTHTTYCHHATNTVEESILQAIKLGHQTIGFSEHAPLNVHRNFRLNLDNFNEYVEEINFYKRKFKDQIEVLCGLECEYHKSQYEYYKKLKETPGIDYLILGNHNMGNPHKCQEWNALRCSLKAYGEQIVQAAESNLFSCIAHPDYIFRFYLKWDKKAIDLTKLIIKTSIKHDLPLAFNLNGLRVKLVDFDYPCDQFWDVVRKSKAKVIIETDAHSIDTMGQPLIDKGIALIKRFKLEKNIIEKLELK